MLRATVLDAERRGNAHHSRSAFTVDAVAALSRRGNKMGKERSKSYEGEGGSHDCIAGEPRLRDADGPSTTGKDEPAENDERKDMSSTHLGAIDISKVSEMLKGARQTQTDARHTPIV